MSHGLTAAEKVEQEPATGGILGPVIATIGLVVSVASAIALVFDPLAATTLISGVVLLIGGVLVHQLTLNGRKQERDMTELMEIITELN